LLTSKYIYFILPLFCYDMNMNSLDCLLLWYITITNKHWYYFYYLSNA
jgi:hypothetical protein